MIFIVLVLVTAVVVIYLNNTRTFGYWKRKGISYKEPILIFGTYKDVFLQKKSRSQEIDDVYWKYPNEKVVGCFKSTTPELVIRDPELINIILVTNFLSFYKRGVNQGRDVEILRKNLFLIDGDPWRMLRQRMTPEFTSGKLKAMFPLIVERTEKLQSRSVSAAAKNLPLDARELMARYTTDFIGACGFGIDSDSLNDEDSAFRRLGRKSFQFTKKDAFILLLRDVFPILDKYLKFLGRIESELLGLVRHILQKRDYKPCGRNDFIDFMLEYLNKPMEAESIEKVSENDGPTNVKMIFDENLFAAQVFVFFVAGFETSASSTSYTLHLLAFNPEVQRKVQESIDEVLAKHNKKLSYEAVKEMTYLEWTFKEGLRMFPSLGYLMRRCTRKFTFKDIALDIDEGVNVVIPIQSLHMDPKYWDSPEEFRPERFHPDNFGTKQKIVYYPFGEGPRNCIGSRLGLMQSMAGLAAILAKFTVEPAPETVRYPKIDPRSNIVQSIIGGLPLMFRQRESK